MDTNTDNRPDQERFPDCMVDLETTGLNQGLNAIIQIAGVKFNLAERTVSHDFFDQCLLIPDTRFWMESTRDWWLKRKEVLYPILARGRDPKTVLQELSDWAHGDRVLWGKPTHFDHSFLGSYYQQYEMGHPFMYRKANDMNSFIRARYYPDPAPNWERELDFSGKAHNALHDCLHQVKVLFAAMDDTMVQSKRLTQEAEARTVESAPATDAPT